MGTVKHCYSCLVLADLHWMASIVAKRIQKYIKRTGQYENLNHNYYNNNIVEEHCLLVDSMYMYTVGSKTALGPNWSTLPELIPVSVA